METDSFIRTLTADQDWRERPVGIVLLLTLVLASPISLAMFFATLGVRSNFMVSLGNPFFDLKFLVTLSLAIAAIAISLLLARPGASLQRRAWLLCIPLALIGVGVAADFMVPQRTTWTARLVGSNSRVCMMAIPAFALPLLIAAIIALRRGASTRPALAGAFAGMLSAGLAAALYATHCPDDSPLFVATWYSIAIALTAAIGALAGRSFLRI